MTKEIFIDTTVRADHLVELRDICGVTSPSVLARKTGDIDVVSAAKELLTENNLTLKMIDSIGYNRGPGSFTGLRIGAAVANTLAWALGIEGGGLPAPDYGSEPKISVRKKI